MREKSTILIKKVTTILLLVVVALLAYFLFTSPVAFQKSAAITFATKSELVLSEPESYINIEEILHKIPYKDNGGMVYEISPKQKYTKTIQEGYGNCSNLAFGLAYFLDQKDHVYQIVHLMPPDGFLNGRGHTVVNIPYTIKGNNNYGIVDVLEGGLPQDSDMLIDINLLRKGGFNNPSILSLNLNKDNSSPYYTEFLNGAVIGIIKSNEVRKYFDFIDNIYVPLGNKKAEKMLYDGLSILFGYYPRIYVLKDDLDVLFRKNKIDRILANSLIISIRILLVLFVLLVVYHIFTVVDSRITKQMHSDD